MSGGDPDLAVLRRDARRRDRWRRAGNATLAAVIGALVLANALVIRDAASGVATAERMARVDLVGIPLLGRDAAVDPGGAGAAAGGGGARGENASDGAGAGPFGDPEDGDPSLPTWSGGVGPTGDEAAGATPGQTAAPSVEAPAAPPADAVADVEAEVPTTAQAAAAPPATTPAPLTQPAGPAKLVLDLVNAERAAAGCQPLTTDARLGTAAAGHAADMVARQFFDHTSPDGSTPATRAVAAGYDGPVAENIATGYASPEVVVAGWMDSAGHRANIVDCDQRVTGIGYDAGSLPGYAPGTWVQVFGQG